MAIMQKSRLQNHILSVTIFFFAFFTSVSLSNSTSIMCHSIALEIGEIGVCTWMSSFHHGSYHDTAKSDAESFDLIKPFPAEVKTQIIQGIFFCPVWKGGCCQSLQLTCHLSWELAEAFTRCLATLSLATLADNFCFAHGVQSCGK